MPGNADTTIAQLNENSDPGEKDRHIQSRVDRFIVHVSNVTAWLFPILILATTSQVVLRKLGHNQAWLDDAQWWIYGFAMTVGFVYAITTQSHVRVDILFAGFNKRKKSRIEIFGLGWLLLPYLILMTDVLVHYAWSSVLAGEGSDSPNGLHRLYLLKLSLPIVFALGIMAAGSMLLRHLAVIGPVRVWTVVLAALPAVWFIAERLCFYLLWWFVRLSNGDINPRRISREPLLEPAMWYGLALVAIGVIVSVVLERRNRPG